MYFNISKMVYFSSAVVVKDAKKVGERSEPTGSLIWENSPFPLPTPPLGSLRSLISYVVSLRFLPFLPHIGAFSYEVA